MSTTDRMLRFPRNRDDLLRWYQSLYKKARRLRAIVDRLDTALDSMHMELAETLKEANALPLASFDSEPSLTYPSKTPSIDEILRAEAERGVEKVDFNQQSNGKVTVTINGTSITLSPVLGELLIVLADQTPTKIDPQPTVLVPWKEAEEVRMTMLLRRGRHFSRGNVWNCVNKLRNCLSRGLLNPYLIQTNREKGLLRLALRREER